MLDRIMVAQIGYFDSAGNKHYINCPDIMLKPGREDAMFEDIDEAREFRNSLRKKDPEVIFKMFTVIDRTPD